MKVPVTLTPGAPFFRLAGTVGAMLAQPMESSIR
jgi:hypothetical protein